MKSIEGSLTFIYPDMKTALTGTFEKGVMIQGSPSKIIAERCNDGVKELKLSAVDNKSPSFKYTRATRLHIGDQPTEMDPYEKQTVYIKELKWGGDSLFAKRNIKNDEIVSYLGGIFWNGTELQLFPHNSTHYDW